MNTEWKTLWWLIFLTIIGSYGGVNAAKKRVCIIGTGVAGIAALKQVAMHPKELEPIVFEKKSGEGGLWIYTDRTTGYDEFGMPVRNNVYKYLRHYSKHYVPELPGLKSFPGTIFHSIFYRRPEQFRGQTVVVMDSGTSGTDIGLQISWFAEKVYLSHRRKLGVEIPKNMEEVPAAVSVNGNKLALSDGQVIVADAFILCTGYQYNFPFLGDDSGIEVVEGKYIQPLYKHLINIEHPTMAFVGILFPSAPFAVAYAQSQYITSVLMGKTKLPSRQQMLDESRLPPGVPISRGHYLAEDSLDYYDELAGLSNNDLVSDTLMARIFWHWVNDKKNDLMHFKDKDVVVAEDGSIELRRQYYPVYGRDYTEFSVY